MHSVLCLQVEHLSVEWQYLFSEAGVTEDMLRDKATLQFILDTVYEIGGVPQELPTISKSIFRWILNSACQVVCIV